MNEIEIEQLKRMVDIYIYQNLTTKPNECNPEELELANTVRGKLNFLNVESKFSA